MTKEQAITKLREIQMTYGKDAEVAHCMADCTLIDFLIGLGYTEVVKEYERVVKWYA